MFAAYLRIGKGNLFRDVVPGDGNLALDGQRRKIQLKRAVDGELFRLVCDICFQGLSGSKRCDRLQPGADVHIVRIVPCRDRERLRGCKRNVCAHCGDANPVLRFADRHVAEIERDAQRRQKLPCRDRDPLLRGGDHRCKVEREKCIDERRHVNGSLRHGERCAEEIGDDFHHIADGDAHLHAVHGKIDDGRITLIGEIKRLLRAVEGKIERAAHGEGGKIQRDISAQCNVSDLRRKSISKIDVHRVARDKVRKLENHACEVGIGGRISHFGNGRGRIGKFCAHLHARKRQLRRDAVQRDSLAVLCDIKGKIDGKFHARDREHRGKRCASIILRDGERTAAQLL